MKVGRTMQKKSHEANTIRLCWSSITFFFAPQQGLENIHWRQGIWRPRWEESSLLYIKRLYLTSSCLFFQSLKAPVPIIKLFYTVNLWRCLVSCVGFWKQQTERLVLYSNNALHLFKCCGAYSGHILSICGESRPCPAGTIVIHQGTTLKLLTGEVDNICHLCHHPPSRTI